MRLAVGLFAVALAVAASQTRVFTDGADIVCAVAFASFVALSFARARIARPKPMSPSTVAVVPGVSTRSAVVWTALALCAIGFELFNYAESPRRAHPTVSSALTVLATHPFSRGFAFLAWFALGIWIATS